MRSDDNTWILLPSCWAITGNKGNFDNHHGPSSLDSASEPQHLQTWKQDMSVISNSIRQQLETPGGNGTWMDSFHFWPSRIGPQDTSDLLSRAVAWEFQGSGPSGLATGLPSVWAAVGFLDAYLADGTCFSKHVLTKNKRLNLKQGKGRCIRAASHSISISFQDCTNLWRMFGHISPPSLVNWPPMR